LRGPVRRLHDARSFAFLPVARAAHPGWDVFGQTEHMDTIRPGCERALPSLLAFYYDPGPESWADFPEFAGERQRPSWMGQALSELAERALSSVVAGGPRLGLDGYRTNRLAKLFEEQFNGLVPHIDDDFFFVGARQQSWRISLVHKRLDGADSR